MGVVAVVWARSRERREPSKARQEVLVEPARVRTLGYRWSTEMGRVELPCGRIYRVLYCIYDNLAELVVIRQLDGQIVAKQPYSRVAWIVRSSDDMHEDCMSFLTKQAEKDARSAASASRDGMKFQERFAAIVEWTTSTEFPEGGERQTATVMILSEDGVYKCCLNDRQNSRSLWVSGPSLLDALDALEAILRAGTGEWRAYTPFKGKKPQKRS